MGYGCVAKGAARLPSGIKNVRVEEKEEEEEGLMLLARNASDLSAEAAQRRATRYAGPIMMCV
jgi:hypothetical protein